MKILVISDLHGDFTCAVRACELARPELLLCCGDWGDADQVAANDLELFLEFCPLLTTFGNHDPLALLAATKNRDGSSVLLGQGEIRRVAGMSIASIGGIWAKSHRLPHYVTDQDVARFALEIATAGPVEILLTHACPVGLADVTPSGRHGGQRCFLNAFNTISPRLHLCGHLHVAQERAVRDGRKVINVGATPEGSIAVVEFDARTSTLVSHLESVPCSSDRA
jgi:Icc-related predicted phosphoesterase